jgi:hypothetical protein
LLISQRFPAITIRERQWTGRKARRDRGLAAAPEFIVRSPDQEREALPVTSDEIGALSIARRRKR